MIRITGHRGAMAHAPENTALSFITAEDQAVDEIELDVRLSADGVPVIRHDAHLVDENGPLVADLTWSEIKTYDLPRGQRVLNLAEVLALTSTELQIEVKDPGAVPVIAETLTEFAEERRRSRLTCFDAEVLADCQRQMPDVRRGLIAGRFRAELLETAQRVGATALYSGWDGLTGLAVEEFHQAGIEVGGWPLRTRTDADLAVHLGVDVITTDDPASARVWLGEAAGS